MFDAVLQALVNGLIAGALLAIPALGFSAIFAVLRFPNFAIGALATAGAYIAWIANVTFGLPIVAAIVVAFVSAAIFGAVARVRCAGTSWTGRSADESHRIACHGDGDREHRRFFFGNDLRAFDLPLARDLSSARSGSGRSRSPTSFSLLRSWLAVWAFLSFSTLGRSMRAVADNADLARLKGINPRLIALVTVAVGSGLCGVGGTLIGLDTSIDPLLGGRVLLSVFAAAVLGGLGSIPGAVVGAFVIGIVEEFTVLALAPAYRLAVGFIVILVVLVIRPSGLLGSKAG